MVVVEVLLKLHIGINPKLIQYSVVAKITAFRVRKTLIQILKQVASPL